MYLVLESSFVVPSSEMRFKMLLGVLIWISFLVAGFHFYHLPLPLHLNFPLSAVHFHLAYFLGL